MIHTNLPGVPDFMAHEFSPKKNKYAVCIPILNENGRIQPELQRAVQHQVHTQCDIVICDGGSNDGSTDHETLKNLGVNTLLIKTGPGRQGAQLRMGFWWAMQRGYEGVVTIDGNNKDSIEDIPCFLKKLDDGFDFIQGSRYVPGGQAINTPKVRELGIRLVHAPIISLTARQKFTDTTNAFRGYSKKYLEHQELQPFRDIFSGYELLAYLSVMAPRLGLKTVEIPVKRSYPDSGEIPTKITPIKGYSSLMVILLKNFLGLYTPNKNSKK